MDYEQVTKRVFQETFKLYEEKAYTKEEGSPVLCEIHDAFGGQGTERHNCLGCNFADSQNLIHGFLSQFEMRTDVRESFSLYVLTLYLLVERMDIIMDIVQVPLAYREKHFKVFQQIRKWANFIKHPKSFILTHHPEYNFENSGIESEKVFSVVVNDQFVTDYYKGEKDPEQQRKINKKLYDVVRNKSDVKVVFPDIIKLTSKLCYSIVKFKDLIIKNDVYKEILNDEATISDYFENQV